MQKPAKCWYVNPEWFRPTDVDNLWGDQGQNRSWMESAETTYAELVEIMAKHDRQLTKTGKAMKAAL